MSSWPPPGEIRIAFETIIIDKEAKQVISWFPSALTHYRMLATGRTWVGADRFRLVIYSLEGA